ncbi:hypothetical protein ACNR9Q_02455 [Maribacter sp. X9]|uniref:hypothetical protein n=1 Tax=Maribacter sp. X9 TaxID=3402159 RepID=UPI003AF3FF7D
MMIKYFLASFSLIFLMTCEKEDEVEDCAAVSCLAQTASIEYVNANGDNLIANKTYLLKDIRIVKEENLVNTNQETEETQVQFFISGSEGENTYSIELNDSENDILTLNLNMTSPRSECCNPIFEIINATYNGSSIEIITENNGPKIVVVKSQD